MNETLESSDELLATVRASLPATEEELASSLGIAQSSVATVIRKLRATGYAVQRRKGTFYGADQLEKDDLNRLEHRNVAYMATMAATINAQFPTPTGEEIARLTAERLGRLNDELSRGRKIAKLRNLSRRAEERKADIDRQLVELGAV